MVDSRVFVFALNVIICGAKEKFIFIHNNRNRTTIDNLFRNLLPSHRHEQRHGPNTYSTVLYQRRFNVFLVDNVWIRNILIMIS
jgi:hypothetical protein